jgi:hypothetical protein
MEGWFCYMLDILPPDLPTKTLPCWCSLATSHYEILMVGPVLGSKSTKHFSDQMVLRVHCCFNLLPPSIKHKAFQLFVIKSFMSLSSSAFVSSAAMSWLFIVFLFLDFHMAHIIIEIIMCSLLESLLRLFSKESATVPLIKPVVMFGHSLDIVLPQIFLAVFHANVWPLFQQSNHICCLSSRVSIESFFVQKEQCALSSYPGMLCQYGPHFILPISMLLIWSLGWSGTPSALKLFSNFSFVGCSPVASWSLSFASSNVAWCSIGVTFHVCHFRRVLYICLASSVWGLAPSWRAG